jgi:gluconokinase
MAAIPGLRSPYAKVGRLVFFGRMLDKIRLQAAGKLPEPWCANIGAGQPYFFDARTCAFLGLKHEELAARTLQGGTDAEILAWAESRGVPRSDQDCLMWNQFMMKVGWRDDRTEALQTRTRAHGYSHVATAFDFIEVDEDRDPVASKPWELRTAQALVLTGVSGTGKTTLGESLAQALGWRFRDGDEFHSKENIAKMSAGVALTDADRAPWLQAIRDYLINALAHGENTIVACSALKAAYRQELKVDPAHVRLVCLQADYQVLLQRLEQRTGHFMKANMLKSQFEALEPPTADEFVVDADQPPAAVVAAIRKELGL